MTVRRWDNREELDILTLTKAEFFAKYPDRTENGYRFKIARLGDVIKRELQIRESGESGVIYHDKADGAEFSWREAIGAARNMQEVMFRGKQSQDFATIELNAEVEDPFVLFLSDTHIGDWGTNYDHFLRITDEILSTPGLYVALLGDITNMAIKLRSVAEVTGGSQFTPEQQAHIFEGWLSEIAHKVVFSTWDNHAVEREEAGSGISMMKAIQAKRVVYFGGIGHPDIIVGEQRYGFAVSHRFRGSSVTNPCYAPMRYLREQAPGRDLAAMGDYHVPGIAKFIHGGAPKVAVNTGSTQTGSVYARRYFSLFTQPVMPGVVLGSVDRALTPYWSVGEWRKARFGR